MDKERDMNPPENKHLEPIEKQIVSWRLVVEWDDGKEEEVGDEVSAQSIDDDLTILQDQRNRDEHWGHYDIRDHDPRDEHGYYGESEYD